jgi:hypothetical protein
VAMRIGESQRSKVKGQKSKVKSRAALYGPP